MASPKATSFWQQRSTNCRDKRSHSSSSFLIREYLMLSSYRRYVPGFEQLRLALPLMRRQALDDARAAVPAQDGVVISLGTNLLRLAEVAHGLFKEHQQRVRLMSSEQLRLGAALVHDAGVIVA